MKGAKYAYEGEMLTISEISRRTGITRGQLYRRLAKNGGDMEEAVRGATKGNVRLHMWHGKLMSMREIARRTGINPSTIAWRMRRYGVDAEVATQKSALGQEKQYMFRGKWMSLAEISEVSGVAKHSLRQRINEHGATAEEAADKNYIGPRFTLNGETVSISGAARRTGIPAAEIRARLAPGTAELDGIVNELRKARLNADVPEESEQRKETVWERAALKVFSGLFNSEVAKREMVCVIEDRVWRIEGDLLRYEVRLKGKRHARFVAMERMSGDIWMDREVVIE